MTSLEITNDVKALRLEIVQPTTAACYLRLAAASCSLATVDLRQGHCDLHQVEAEVDGI